MSNDSGLNTVAVLVSLHIGRFPSQKVDRIKTEKLIAEEQAASGRAKVSKVLLSKAFTDRIDKLVRSTRDWLSSRSMPYTLQGVRLLPITLMDETQRYLLDRRGEFERAVAEGKAGLAEAVEAAQRDLSGLFNPADYPNPEVWAREFEFEFDFIEIAGGVMTDMFRDALGNGLADYEAKLAKQHRQVAERAERDLVARIREVTENLMDKCLKDSKSTKLYPSLVENVVALIDLVPHLNMTGNPGIDAGIAGHVQVGDKVDECHHVLDQRRVQLGGLAVLEALVHEILGHLADAGDQIALGPLGNLPVLLGKLRFVVR